MIRGGWRRWTSHKQGDVEFRGDGVNFQGILKRLVLKKHPERMLQAFHMARNKSLKLGEGDYTTGISACGRSKLWQDACWIFASMLDTEVKQTVISYSAAISACEKSFQWQKASILFQEMSDAKIRRDTISYNATLSAYEKGGQWTRALSLFEDMSHACCKQDS